MKSSQSESCKTMQLSLKCSSDFLLEMWWCSVWAYLATSGLCLTARSIDSVFMRMDQHGKQASRTMRIALWRITPTFNRFPLPKVCSQKTAWLSAGWHELCEQKWWAFLEFRWTKNWGGEEGILPEILVCHTLTINQSLLRDLWH